MQYIDQSKKNVLIMVMLVISIVAMYNWFITPQTRYLAAAQKYREATGSVEKTVLLISSQVKTQRKELAGVLQQFELQKQNLFDTDRAKDFLANLQSVAEKNGCMVVNIKHSPAAEVPVKDNNSIDIELYQVSIKLSGGYENIVEFLNTIQSGMSKVWIESVDIGMKDVTSGYLTCNITLSVYALKIKEIQGNVDAKK
jgi:Tfp pilus assembly protein PilO